MGVKQITHINANFLGMWASHISLSIYFYVSNLIGNTFIIFLNKLLIFGWIIHLDGNLNAISNASKWLGMCLINCVYSSDELPGRNIKSSHIFVCCSSSAIFNSFWLQRLLCLQKWFHPSTLWLLNMQKLTFVPYLRF